MDALDLLMIGVYVLFVLTLARAIGDGMGEDNDEDPYL